MAQSHVNKEFIMKDKKKKSPEVVLIRSLHPQQQQQQQQKQEQQQLQQDHQQPQPSVSATLPNYGSVAEFGQVVRQNQYKRNTQMDLTVQGWTTDLTTMKMTPYSSFIVLTQRDCSFSLDHKPVQVNAHKWKEIIEERVLSFFNPIEYELVIGNLQSLSVSHCFRQKNLRQMFVLPSAPEQILYRKKIGCIITPADEEEFLRNVQIYLGQF